MAEKRETRMGMNRTGIDASPVDGKHLIEGAENSQPSSTGDETALRSVWEEYYSQNLSVGTVPVPGTVRGAAQSFLKKLGGKNPEVFIDKLGERLGFERTWTRLYELLIQKCEIKGLDRKSLKLLRQFRDEEAEHFQLLVDCMREIGADPTAMTPSADVAGVESEGVLKVIADTRTSLAHCFSAILVAELVDNDGWMVLATLADEMGMSEMASRFRQALEQEANHLSHIREIYEDMVLSEARMRKPRAA